MTLMKPTPKHIYRIQDPDYGTLHCLCLAVEPDLLRPDTFKGVRVTLTRKHHDFPGWVRLGAGDPVPGYVDAHDTGSVDYAELKEDLGAISIATMIEVRNAVRRSWNL